MEVLLGEDSRAGGAFSFVPKQGKANFFCILF
jgi:hypothetical protein